MELSAAVSVFSQNINEYLALAFIIVASLLVGRILYWILRLLVKRATPLTKTKVDDVFLKTVESPLVFLVFMLGIWFGIKQLSGLPDEVNDVLFKTLKVLMVIDVAYFISVFISKGVMAYLEGKKFREESDMEKALPAIGRIINVIVIIATAIFIFEIVGFNVTSLLAGLGIGGLALAFAARDTIANVFTSIAVLADKTFKIGDRIKFQGNEGVVKEIGLRSTKIEMDSGSHVIIPNNKFAGFPVENLTSRKRKQMGEIVLKLEGSQKISKIKKAVDGIKKILKKEEMVKDKFYVYVTGLDGSGVEIKVEYAHTDKAKAAEVKQGLLLKIKELLDKNKIKLV